MFESELFTDFKIKVKGGGILKAHRSVLATRSKVFASMLSNDMKEANEGIVNVPDFNMTTMKEILRFIYCNKVENLDEIARNLIYGAEKYELEGLKKICIDSIIKTLTVKNVIPSLVIADRVSESGKLYEKSLEFIKK